MSLVLLHRDRILIYISNYLILTVRSLFEKLQPVNIHVLIAITKTPGEGVREGWYPESLSRGVYTEKVP